MSEQQTSPEFGNTEWSERFYTAFQRVQKMLRAELSQQLSNEADFSITRVQHSLLRHLHKKGPLTIGDLADWMSVKPATMSPIIDRLERSRLVARSKTDNDRRVVKVQLTEEGRVLIQKLEMVWRRKLDERLQRLSREEQQQIVELLEKFIY